MLDILTSAGFDVETATRAYLDTLQGSARARSDAYFEGGYWLILFSTAMSVLIDWLILRFRLSNRFRRAGERVFKRAFAITWFTALLYTALGWMLSLPWSIYTDFVREKQFDLLDQSFGEWLGESLIALVILIIIFPVLAAIIYTLIRTSPRHWWIWGAGVSGIFLMITIMVSPVFIAPLFNDYTQLEDGPLRDRIAAIAASYDVPADNIYVFDQSKQHKRISANVSGLGPTVRISLNDNLLERTSEEEIIAVMGHELGH